MPEYTPERARFQQAARHLARQAAEGHDWGQFIVVSLDTGYAYRTSMDRVSLGDLAWRIGRKPTTVAALMRRWDAAVKRRAAEALKADRREETSAKP